MYESHEGRHHEHHHPVLSSHVNTCNRNAFAVSWAQNIGILRNLKPMKGQFIGVPMWIWLSIIFTFAVSIFIYMVAFGGDHSVFKSFAFDNIFKGSTRG